MFTIHKRHESVTAPCPKLDPHRPHFHPGGEAKCPGIVWNCATMGHEEVALDHAIGCQRCGSEYAL